MKGTLDRGIRILIAANIVLVGVLATVLLIDVLRSNPGHPVQAAASPSASPVELMQMGLAHIPTSNACVLCHDSGGSAGLKPVPALGHPLEGWRQCLTCHTNDLLGRKAPGHDGIAETECLNCHKVAQAGPAITQPHSKLQDQHCLDCHGSYAHLPTSMAGRNEDECTLCHKPTSLPPPAYPHPADLRLGCRDCHQSPQVGNLPIDHALRTDSECLLCHEIKIASAGPNGTPAAAASAAPGPSSSPGLPTPGLPTPGLPTPGLVSPSAVPGSPPASPPSLPTPSLPTPSLPTPSP